MVDNRVTNIVEFQKLLTKTPKRRVRKNKTAIQKFKAVCNEFKIDHNQLDADELHDVESVTDLIDAAFSALDINPSVNIGDIFKTRTSFNTSDLHIQTHADQRDINSNRVRGVIGSFLRHDRRKTAISLFSGAGGDTLGMEMAGLDVIGFVEYNETAQKTHIANFESCKLIGSDIRNIPSDVFAGYSGSVDYIFGGFPCQGFSKGGNKNIDDPRNGLYHEFVRAVYYVQPKWVIGENVSGILNMSVDGVSMADIVVAAFKEIGYTMTYKLVNSARFGVPQERKRVIFIGCRDGLSIEVPDASGAEPKTLRDVLSFSLVDALEMPASLVNVVPESSILTGSGEVSGKPPTNLIKCASETSKLDRITYAVRKKPTFGCSVDLDKTSCTILCTYGRMPRLFVANSVNSKKYLRPYTVSECQKIQGFPSNFKFTGSYLEQITQIGNAVPPQIVECVIRATRG